MKTETLQKLVIQLLPAVVASHPPQSLTTPEEVRANWGALLDEAESVAGLFESRFLKPETTKTE